MLNRNQKLFYTHVFIRDFFQSANALGWVYLYIVGMPIWEVFAGWVLFRVIESFICMPLSRLAIVKYHAKKILFFSLILQGLMFLLFPFSVQSPWVFGLLILIFSMADVTYWPVRRNLERFVVKQSNISQSVGLSAASSVLAHAIGLISVALGLQAHSTATFAIAAIGLLLSFIPFIGMRFENLIASAIPQTPFFKTIHLKKSLKEFFKTPIVTMLTAKGVIDELPLLIMPLLLAYFSVALIHIGLTLSLLVMLGFLANVLLAVVQDGKRRNILLGLGGAVLLLFILFQIFPPSYASAFLLIFGILAGPWMTGIDMLGQTFAGKNFAFTDGGFFLEFVDDTSRLWAYPLLFVVLLFSQKSYFYHYSLFIGAIAVMIALYIFKKYYYSESNTKVL